MKRTLRLILLAAILVAVLVSVAAAEEINSAEETLVESELHLLQYGDFSGLDVDPYAVSMLADTAELDTAIYNGLSTCTLAIDVSEYGLYYNASTQSCEALLDAVGRVINGHPELFYVERYVSYGRNSAGLITTLYPIYTMVGAELSEAKQYYQSELQKILDCIDEDWTQLEIIMFINDYLSVRYEYDYNYQNFDVYSFFKEGTGVCTAYYLTTKALLDECGYISTYGRSYDIEHIWNIIFLNGNWYHLDVTWNDVDSFGRVYHDYFMLSTDELLRKDPARSDWFTDRSLACSSKIYDSNRPWIESFAPFVYLGGKWYYSANDLIYVTDDISIEGTALFQVGSWPVPENPGYVYTNAYCGLGTYNGWLIYNTPNAVMAYNPLDKSTTTIYSETDSAKDIFGILVTGDQVSFVMDKHACSKSDCTTRTILTKTMVLKDIRDLLAVGYCGGEGDGTNLKWVLDKDGNLTISGVGKMADYSSALKLPWRDYRGSIKKLVIDDEVTTIGELAFYECTAMTSVEIGSSVKTIGNGAFSYCSGLASVTIPDSVTTLGTEVFANCRSLTSADLGNAVSDISAYLFINCAKLTSVTIPDSVTSIGTRAFYYCTDLSSLTIGKNVSSIGDQAFYNCGALTTVEIPDSVLYVGDYAFYDCKNITSVKIGNGVENIGKSAFANAMAMTSLKLGSGLKNIGECAFMFSFDLTELIIPDGVETIGSDAFNGNNSIEELVIPDSVKTVGDQAFANWNALSSLSIGSGVDTIGDGAFSSCGQLISVTIPDNVITLGDCAFQYCYDLEEVTIGESVESIGNSAFGSCSALTSIVIPDSVTIIGDYAFSGCELLSAVTLGSGLEAIGSYSFYNCYELKDLIVPAGVNTIGSSAFEGCFGLSEICFEGNAPTIDGYYTFVPYTTLFYIPGMTGWTDSDAYNAADSTWNGYPLAIWTERAPEEPAPEEPVAIPYQFTTSMTASLELESEVFLNVAPQLTDLEGNALTTEEAQAVEGNVGMLIWDAANAPAEADATIDVCDNVILGATYNTSTKRFDVKSAGIAAKNLGDSLTIRAFYKDGDQVIYGKYVAGYSPKKYCYNQITKAAATKDVCIALLNYGAAAQVYFDHNTDNMMNSELTAAQQTIAWTDDLVRSTWTVDAAKEGELTRQNPPVNSRAGTLELEGAINVVFTGGATGITVDKAQLLIWTEADFAANEVLTAENATEVVDMNLRSDGKYEYTYTGVPAKGMFDVIYACQMYTDTDGNVYYGGVLPFCAERYGFMNYNKADAKVANLAKTMIVYGAAARNYFG